MSRDTYTRARVSSAEKGLIGKEAKRQGLSVSNLIRQSLGLPLNEQRGRPKGQLAPAPSRPLATPESLVDQVLATPVDDPTPLASPEPGPTPEPESCVPSPQEVEARAKQIFNSEGQTMRVARIEAKKRLEEEATTN